MTKDKIFLVIAALVLVFALGVAIRFGMGGVTGTLVKIADNINVPANLAGGTRFVNGISTDTTSPSAGEVRTTTLTVTATTTLTQSVDGLVVGGTISTAATGTVLTVYTNSTGPKMCDSSVGYLHFQNNGSFAPTFTVSVGTSTSAIASTNLLASTTISTSTPGTTKSDAVPLPDRLFRLGNGDVLTAILADSSFGGSIGGASTTNYANWAAEVGFWCQDVTI